MWTIYELDAKSGQFGSSVVSALPGEIIDVCQNGAEFNPINVKLSVPCGLMMGQWSFEKLQCAKTGASCSSVTSEKNYTQWYWGPNHAGQVGPFVDRRSMDAALTIDAIDLQSWGTVSYGWTLNWSHGPRDHLEISSIGRVADTEVCFDPASCIGVAEVLMGESEKKMETRGLTGYSAYLPAAVIFTYSGLGAYFEFAETPSEFRFGNRWAEGF